MANFYSDHYSDDGTAATGTAATTSIDDPRIKAPAGISHGKLRYKRGQIATTTALSAGDVLRFFSLKSSDRILEMYLSKAVDASTSMTADLGLYTEGGSVLDLDLFGDVANAPFSDITVAVTRSDVLTNAGTVTDADRGKALWEMYALGAGSDTSDPLVNYDIGLTCAAEVGAVAITSWALECYYVPGAHA